MDAIGRGLNDSGLECGEEQDIFLVYETVRTAVSRSTSYLMDTKFLFRGSSGRGVNFPTARG